VHRISIVSKQSPVTLPTQPPRHVPSAERHVAAPLCTWATHCSRQFPRPLEPAHPWTHVFAAAPTFAKHVCALVPQPAGQVPGAGQLPWQSESDVPQAVRDDAIVARHARRHARGDELEAHFSLHARRDIIACLAQTLLPDTQLLWQGSASALRGAAASATARRMVAWSIDRIVFLPRFAGRAPRSSVLTYHHAGWSDKHFLGVCPRVAVDRPPALRTALPT
jgi:hypothetical protein